MHVWTVVLGKIASIASGKPVRPSTHAIRMSRHPAGLQIVEHLHPELRALGLLKPHAQHVAVPVERDPEREVQRAALDGAALADLEDHAVQEHDRVDVLQRPLAPVADVVHHAVGDAADQVAADVHAVDLLEVRLDVARGEPAAVKREDLVVEPDEPPLALADNLGLEAAVTVAGRVDRDLPVLADQRLRGRPIALVGGAAGRLLVRLVADVVGQLDLHRALHQALGQLGEQPAGPGDLLLRRGAGEQLVDHLVADPPVGRHTQSLTDPTAAGSAVDGVIDDLGRHGRGVRGGRAAPGLPSADLRSFYELAAIVAGQPRRDPHPQVLEPWVALQHAAALLSGVPASRSSRHGDLFRSGLHSRNGRRPPRER